MREYSVLLPLGPIGVGDSIDRAAWPPHVTIQSNVLTDAPQDVVIAAVRDATAQLGPLCGAVGEEAHFGPDGSILVNLVESSDFRRAHDVVNASLQLRAGAVSVTPGFDGDGYHAHVTVTSHGRAQQGDRLALQSVVLVEIGPEGDRSIALPIASFDLGEPAS